MKRLATLALFALAACDDPSMVLEEQYATLDEARADGAIERGWIPSWIPLTAITIQEIHDLDTNVSTLRLSFSTEEGWSIPATCKPASASSVRGPRLAPEWWPRGVPSTDAVGAAFEYFNCDAESELRKRATLAVSEARGELLFWRWDANQHIAGAQP
jgi:hypothetical protein